MEKKLNKIAENYVTKFKNDIKQKMIDLDLDKTKINEMLVYVYDYERLIFSKEDFVKRKRTKNSIPQMNRCNAKRANGEQCTRRRKKDCEFCGTHHKGVPYGLVMVDEDTNDIENDKLEVIAKDIQGIIYYIDKYNNVYKTEDILEGKENPAIIASYVLENNEYKIPDFGLV